MLPQKRLAILTAILIMGFAVSVSAAEKSESAKPDPQIEKALKEVSAKQLEASITKLVSFGTRLTVSTNLPPESGRGVLAARDWLRAEFESYSKACGGCLEVKVQTFTEGVSARIPQPTELNNVYAILRGSDPESAKRIIVIDGHYDSIAMARMTDPAADAPGANDDGSGTALTLEAARVLSKYKFPATIVFAIFDAEEQGLFGSKGFAKMAKAEGWNIEAVLSNDIVGGDKNPGQDPKVVRIFSESIPATAVDDKAAIGEIRLVGLENDSPSRQIARYLVETSEEYACAGSVRGKMIYRQDRYLRGGDHTSFNQQGFAAVRMTEWREDYAHQHEVVRTENGIQYGDLLKFVDFNYLAGVTRLNIAAAASLASAPAPPVQVRIDAKKLDNDTTLTWQASPDGKVDHYEVVMRDTTSPVWERSKDAGTATTITLPESKDNTLFGVCAVDAQGHRSLVVIPVREGRKQERKE